MFVSVPFVPVIAVGGSHFLCCLIVIATVALVCAVFLVLLFVWLYALSVSAQLVPVNVLNYLFSFLWLAASCKCDVYLQLALVFHLSLAVLLRS